MKPFCFENYIIGFQVTENKPLIVNMFQRIADLRCNVDDSCIGQIFYFVETLAFHQLHNNIGRLGFERVCLENFYDVRVI